MAEAETNSMSGSESKSARKPMKRSGSLSTTAIFTLWNGGFGAGGNSGPFFFADTGGGAGGRVFGAGMFAIPLAYPALPENTDKK